MEHTIVPSRRALFAGFFSIGMAGFGGVLPLAHYMLVQQRRWLSDAEFTELLSLGQLLPGPNIVNMSVVIGSRFHGAQGAVIAFTGLLLAPFCIGMLLVSLYAQYRSLPALQAVLHGLAPAATGLIFAVGLRLLGGLERRWWCWLLALLTFVGIGLLHLPLLPLLLLLLPLAVWLARHLPRKDD